MSNAIIRELEIDALRQQTEMFWYLQLLFLEMDDPKLSRAVSVFMTPSEQSWDILSIRIKFPSITQEEQMELATQLALHLSGLGEL